jgi:hypothetical protein
MRIESRGDRQSVPEENGEDAAARDRAGFVSRKIDFMTDEARGRWGAIFRQVQTANALD